MVVGVQLGGEGDLDEAGAAVADVAEPEALHVAGAAPGQGAQARREGEVGDAGVDAGEVRRVARAGGAGDVDEGAEPPAQSVGALHGAGGVGVLVHRLDAAQTHLAGGDEAARQRDGARRRCGHGESGHGREPGGVAPELGRGGQEPYGVRQFDRHRDGAALALPERVAHGVAGAAPEGDQEERVGRDAVLGSALGGGAVHDRRGGSAPGPSLGGWYGCSGPRG